MEIVLAFSTTNRVIYAESLLIAEGISVGVMPLPAAVRAGCGLCLRIGEADFPRVLPILEANENAPSCVYAREAGETNLRPWGGEPHEL